MELYFVVTGASRAEIEAISEVTPDNLLASFLYFRNMNLKEYFKKIGYVPKNFMLDSGAFSAFTTGRNISLIDYMNYIDEYRMWIKYYISLDVIGDPEMTLDYYRIMKKKGYDPIPVFHYGAEEKYLAEYASQTDYIALGATVPILNKAKVAQWIRDIQIRYPSIRLHLLGCNSNEVIRMTGIESCDSATWILAASYGIPKHIPGTSREQKIERAVYNLKYSKEEKDDWEFEVL